MPDDMLASLQADLDERAALGLKRHRRLLQSPQSANILVDDNSVLSFCSNDYLGLANHPALIAAMQQGAALSGTGSGASHLITGHHQYHQDIEERLARFIGLPAALMFSTGYMANLGVVTALLGRSDAVFADKLNHASLNDAAVLSRAALHRYAHNDMAALEQLLANSNARRKLVIVDAVFSMDGDIAPVSEIVALCERYDAYLLVDDAHGFGVLGKQGRGILSHFEISSPRIIYMATLGKAAGVFGAIVAADAVIVESLLQQARTYIYTTATPPAMSAALMAAIDIIETDDARREQLSGNIQYLKSKLALKKWQLAESITAIQPIIIGSNDDAVRLSEHLLTSGILVPAIRPPTVPKGTARLRISLSAAHNESDIDRLVNALHQAEDALS